MSDDRRLIEDLIPVEAINEVAHDKTGHFQAHPRKLHLWWARRPLAAARAATTQPCSHRRYAGDSASAGYFREFCRWGADGERIADARQRVLEANGGNPPRVSTCLRVAGH